MKIYSRIVAGAVLSLLTVVPAWAQSSGQTRPATSTVMGDTGLWFVPTGETLPKGKVAGSAGRINFDRSEGFTDIADFSGSFAFGVTDRLEMFGAVAAFRRIDADRRPILSGNQPMDYPIRSGWEQGFGDVTVGGKLNLRTQATAAGGVAVALRGSVKVPSASRDLGLGTGRPDYMVDAVLSREMGRAELAGYTGVRFRTSPADYDLSHSLRYGVGLGWPSRGQLKLFTEANGEFYFNNAINYRGAFVSSYGGPAASWNVKQPFDVFIGSQYTASNGFYFGTGLSYAITTTQRGSVNGYDSNFGDKIGLQVRLGYHPGVNVYVAPPPPPPPPPPPAPPVNRPPTVTAKCNPCSVLVGGRVLLMADGSDPDGDTLTYKWSAPTGALANASDRQTGFTAPGQPGSLPVTVTVSDGKGGNATASVTIQVMALPKKEYTFEDVHFDFDRYSLRVEATRVLDEAIKALAEDTSLRIMVEGHTCNIGTTEYNLALGERRATAVREYLTNRGVSADRLQTISYGEERPKHDNGREETRRLNRRAAMTVRVQ